jgi:carbon storage regulator CsrA
VLVLSRRVGERVVIGHGISVVVLESNGRRVRLGFDAPEDVMIHREELVAVPNTDGRVCGGEAERYSDGVPFRCTQKSR